MILFWRVVFFRFIGVFCRDDFECITRLCRYFINLGVGLGKRGLGSWVEERLVYI